MRTFYDEITKIAGNVVTVKAQGIAYDDLAVITTGHGTSLAQVIRMEDDQVSLQIFGGTEGVSTGDKIRFLGHSFKVPFGDALLRDGPETAGPRSKPKRWKSARRR